MKMRQKRNRRRKEGNKAFEGNYQIIKLRRKKEPIKPGRYQTDIQKLKLEPAVCAAQIYCVRDLLVKPSAASQPPWPFFFLLISVMQWLRFCKSCFRVPWPAGPLLGFCQQPARGRLKAGVGASGLPGFLYSPHSASAVRCDPSSQLLLAHGESAPSCSLTNTPAPGQGPLLGGLST